MDLTDPKVLSLVNAIDRVSPKLLAGLFRAAKAVPAVRKQLEKQYRAMLGDLTDVLRPYSDAPTYRRLPDQGVPRAEVLEAMKQVSDQEQRWTEGLASGAVYHGDPDHIAFLNEVYAANSQANPLHADLWPSTSKYEAEIVSMTAAMLGGESAGVCGTVTAGGTESILLAMKSYRDHARQRRRITHPEMVIPRTAHAAFDKAAQYFNIKAVHVPLDVDLRADLSEVRDAINRRTIVVVGSAPNFPHGVIDPIEAMSELARARGIGFHTDGCLGGFLLPWARKLGYPVPRFDFELPGVTSMSADTHKYGFAAKGSSVVLYRDADLRRFQYFAAGQWPGGLYCSPTIAGSRPGALSAVCWAAMVATGEQGYLDAARGILEAGAKLREGVERIDGLHVLGDPLWVIAFAADDPSALDIYKVMDRMTTRGWALNGLHHPPCVHICSTLRHAQPGVTERFVADLQQAVEEVRAEPATGGGMAPIYGLAATVPIRGVVADILRHYLDMLFEV